MEESKVAYVVTHFIGKAIDQFNNYLNDFYINIKDNRKTKTNLIFRSYKYFKKKL